MEAQEKAPEDALERAEFVKSLMRHLAGLAEIDQQELPAPRVLAVDAPWGYGKSWIAAELRRQLVEEDSSRKMALIDAFRYDYHADAFPVIASAVLHTLAPQRERKAKFLKAAGEVMKLAAPFAVKAAAKALLSVARVDYDELAEDLQKTVDKGIDVAAELSAKEIEHLFESYARTEQTQEEFQRVLGEMTKELGKPLVVIIDELDRCRPTFALEVLERIKHLFSADNVVFVLFWNSASIEESIRHAYGRATEAAAYLAKFVALSVPVPLVSPLDTEHERGRYYPFVSLQARRALPRLSDRPDFARAMADLAEVFDASLRDVQRAIHLLRFAPAVHREDPALCAYVALLRVVDERRYRALGRRDEAAIAELAGRLPPCRQGDPTTPVGYLWALLKIGTNPQPYRGGSISNDESWILRVASGRRMSHLAPEDRLPGLVQLLDKHLSAS
jgi:hypothetical protein